MTDTKKFIRLHAALVDEKASIEARLNEISKVLGGAGSTAASSTATTTPKGRRTMSEATKAKMRAAQQARWAKKRGVAVVKDAASVDAAKAPRKKRKMSAAGKAAIRAAQKARWAKINPAEARCSTSAAR